MIRIGLVLAAMVAGQAAAQSCDALRSCRTTCESADSREAFGKCMAQCRADAAQLCPAITDEDRLKGDSEEQPPPPPPPPPALEPPPPPPPSTPPPSTGSNPICCAAATLGSVGGLTAMRMRRAPIATRLFTASDFRIPDGFGAVAVLIFPNEAALDPARQQRVCRAFVAVLDDSTAVLAASPSREQMVTIWPVMQVTPALRLTEARRHDSTAVDAICPGAVAAYDYAQASDWSAKLPARARSGSRAGPFLVAWAPPSQAGDPRAPILTYDLSGFSTDNQLLDAFRIWKQEIEDDPQLWSGGWNLTRWRLTTRAMADRYGSEIGAAMKLIPWLGE